MPECKSAGDDAAHRKRPAPYPGPRCFSCHHAQKRRRRVQERLGAVRRGFGLSPTDLEAQTAAQGGRCAICRRVVGRVKQPAVDHDHKHCRGPKGCRECFRGLLCSTCNRYLGHIGDDPETGIRLAQYLISPPWPRTRRALDDS